MDLAEDALGLVRRALHVGPVTDVYPDEMNGIGAFQLLAHFIEMSPIDIRDDDLHAGFEESSRHAIADAAGAAGDERDLSLKVLHVGPFVAVTPP